MGKRPICRLGFIGCGRLMTVQHIQNAHKSAVCKVHTLCDINEETLERVAARYLPEKTTADYKTLLADPEVQLVVIAMRPEKHAELAVAALRAGKDVYVEKPLGVTIDEARSVAIAAKETGRSVAVGFNRRFAPAYRDVKKAVAERESPPMFYYRIADHEMGARADHPRYLGELCHIYDILRWFDGADPVSVYATEGGAHHNDNIITITFAGGSTGVIFSSGRASMELPKEHLEVVWDHKSVTVEDFVEARFFSVPGMPPVKHYQGRAYDGSSSEHVERFAGENGFEALVDVRRRFEAAHNEFVKGGDVPAEFLHLPINYIEDKGWSIALDEMALSVVENRKAENADAVDGACAMVVAFAVSRSIETGQLVELDANDWKVD